MKYYLLVGEASGDLHASHLMKSLKEHDPEAEFRFFGGDNMSAVGGTRVKHYKDLAYMGFIPVLLHLRTIFAGMDLCKRDIVEWQPDVVILVDYAGFNLKIARYLHDLRDKTLEAKAKGADAEREAGKSDDATSGKAKWSGAIYYFIAPKLWAWKEHRIKNIKRDVDELFSILPFEVDFFEKKHGYPIHYVGNPTADEVRKFRKEYKESCEEFCLRNNLDPKKPIIALLAGSRKQEIKDNLPAMLSAVSEYSDYQAVLAGAPSITDEYYSQYIGGHEVGMTHNETYALLSHATAALVTSGTATLETSLFDVPQVVCYKTPLPHLMRWGFNHIIKCKYISLVNLIADDEVVKELFADRFTLYNIKEELRQILPGGEKRDKMLSDYDEIDRRLGDHVAPDNAARIMISKNFFNSLTP